MSEEKNSALENDDDVKLALAGNATQSKLDSFQVPVKKSPLLMYALLQIPLVIFMVALLYFMYQSNQN